MSELRYPNESPDYRKARDELLEEEKALVEKVKAVAEKRRKLPLGGQLKEDYTFEWANDGKVGQEVRLSELFGDKTTLLLYNFMYGPGWDNPCLSCTSLMDGFDRTAYQVSHDAAFCGIAKAPAEKINTGPRPGDGRRLTWYQATAPRTRLTTSARVKTTICSGRSCMCSESSMATSFTSGGPSYRETM